MPVTKTAKRALRVSKKKAAINAALSSRLEIALRKAKKVKSLKTIKEAVSIVDRAAKKGFIHKNKAARIKSQLAKLGPRPAKSTKNKVSKKK